MKRLIVAILLSAGFASLQAQEAFYIYRNDGEFNGFFYDDVKSMRLSKTDLDLTERDEYVVQEIETTDTVYRIPLCAIDSIGFQQPEIIMKKIYDLDDQIWDRENFPYHYNNLDIYADDPYVLHWERPYYYDGNGGFYCKDEELPKVGDLLYRKTWAYGTWNSDSMRMVGEIESPFVGKVRKIIDDPDAPGDKDMHRYVLVVCDPIEDIGEVFEQLITVEQIGWENGSVSSHRFAGEDKVYVRASGNKELTLVNISGTFPLSYGNDDFSATLGIDVALAIKANVAYQVTRQVFNVNITIKEDAEIGISFTAKANLGETTTWHLGGMPIYFPSFLPIFQLDPSPQAFIKSAGDFSVKVSTPKFAYHGSQTIHLGYDGVNVTCTNDADSPGKEGNGWGLELSLNGSIQAGSNYPFKLETNRWLEKGLYAAIGADVYSGPRLAASFTLDPVALAVNSDVYSAFKNTQIKFSPVAVVFEASGEYSIRNKPKTKAKFFEGEKTYGDIVLKLFPDFEKTMSDEPYDQVDTYSGRRTGYCLINGTVYPRGNSVPFKVGMAVYNYKKEMVSKSYTSTLDNDTHMYSFLNTFDELPYTLPLLSGEYEVVPLLDVFGYDVPVWDAACTVTSSPPVVQTAYNQTERTKHYTEGTFVLKGLMKDDKVEFELVTDSTLVQRGSCRWDDTLLDSYPHVVSESSEAWEGCGKKVEIEEDSVGDAEQTLGPEEMGSRTYKYHSDLLWYVRYSGSFVKNKDGYWNTDRYTTDSEGNLKGKSGSYTYVAAQEINVIRARITRGNQVRYGPRMTFVGSQHYNTYNGSE